MNAHWIRNGFFFALLALFLAGCSSTAEREGAGAGAGGAVGAEEGVTTGTAGGPEAWGEDLGAGGVATVFYFDFDKATLKPEARAALNIHAQRLRANPVRIRLEGHADERGTREYNMALGERRANAVKEYLVLQGVDPSLIEVVSYGEERPAALGSDEASYALNRRVEMKRAQ